jgi:hypothetical protein
MQQQSGKKPQGNETQRRENEKQEMAGQPQGAKKEPKDAGKVENNRTDQAKMPPSKTATLAEKAEILERWGLLPKRVVEQMRNSNGKEFPAEYREIITRYYERLSQMHEVESGRR